jgi:hypothetical protein
LPGLLKCLFAQIQSLGSNARLVFRPYLADGNPGGADMLYLILVNLQPGRVDRPGLQP